MCVYFFAFLRHKRFLGHVTWSSLEQSTGGRRKVLLGGPQGVIGAINAGPGSVGMQYFILYPILHNCVAWRREMGGAIHNILHHQSTLVTVSGDSHMLLRAWYTETGLLRWEVPLSSRATPTKQWPLSSRWTPDGMSVVVCGTKKGKRFIFKNDII